MLCSIYEHLFYLRMKQFLKCCLNPRVGGWVFFFNNLRTRVYSRGCERERAEIHATLAQLRLEWVLRILADFSNRLAHLYVIFALLFKCCPLECVNMLKNLSCQTVLKSIVIRKDWIRYYFGKRSTPPMKLITAPLTKFMKNLFWYCTSMLCYAMLCYPILCYAILCNAML
jgi:hypothetical protein